MDRLSGIVGADIIGSYASLVNCEHLKDAEADLKKIVDTIHPDLVDLSDKYAEVQRELDKINNGYIVLRRDKLQEMDNVPDGLFKFMRKPQEKESLEMSVEPIH